MKNKTCLILGDSLPSKTIGGSEFRLLTITKLLSKKHQVFLLIPEMVDLIAIQKLYNIYFDISKVNIIPFAPQGKIEMFFARSLNYRRLFLIRKYAKKCDFCISCANMVDFRKEAIHFIYMLNFDYDFRRTVLTGIHSKPVLASSFWRNFKDYLKCFLFFKPRSAEELIKDKKQIIFANSQWVSNAISEYYGVDNIPVIYPPVLLEVPEVPWKQRQNACLCLGRIDAEKKVEEIISVMSRVREKTGQDIHLHLAGAFGDTPYANMIYAQCIKLPWIHLHGLVYGDTKIKLLQSFKFALHMREDEEFGISVAEYVKAGIIPIVPDKGGAAEIVNIPELCFSSTNDAVDKFISVFSNEELQETIREKIHQRKIDFSCDRFENEVIHNFRNLGIDI